VASFGKCKGGGRRSAARAATPLVAVLSTVTRSQTAALVDVSCTGARLRGANLPGKGQDLLVKMDSVQTFGTIVWSGSSQCGLRFDTPLLEGQVVLLRHRAGLESLGNITPEDRLARDDWATGKAR
jgi:hypothetical protein